MCIRDIDSKIVDKVGDSYILLISVDFKNKAKMFVYNCYYVI